MKKIDRISFHLGMINCFVEMVACGVKKLALSPPISPEDYEIVSPLSDRLVKEYGIHSFLEKSLMVTDLQSEDFTKGKWLILYYDNAQVLKMYKTLKEKKEQLEKMGQYDSLSRKEISRTFMSLLSYPPQKIEERLSKDKPESLYMLIEE